MHSTEISLKILNLFQCFSKSKKVTKGFVTLECLLNYSNSVTKRYILGTEIKVLVSLNKLKI